MVGEAEGAELQVVRQAACGDRVRPRRGAGAGGAPAEQRPQDQRADGEDVVEEAHWHTVAERVAGVEPGDVGELEVQPGMQEVLQIASAARPEPEHNGSHDGPSIVKRRLTEQ